MLRYLWFSWRHVNECCRFSWSNRSPYSRYFKREKCHKRTDHKETTSAWSGVWWGCRETRPTAFWKALMLVLSSRCLQLGCLHSQKHNQCCVQRKIPGLMGDQYASIRCEYNVTVSIDYVQGCFNFCTPCCSCGRALSGMSSWNFIAIRRWSLIRLEMCHCSFHLALWVAV